MSPAAWFFLGVLGFVALVMLEGRRQARRYGAASGRPNLAGVGLLELQRHLQADRKVEVIVEQLKQESGEIEEDSSGEPPAPLARGPSAAAIVRPGGPGAGAERPRQTSRPQNSKDSC